MRRAPEINKHKNMGKLDKNKNPKMGKVNEDKTAGRSRTRILTRKERRKEQRATKKRGKELFFMKKYGKVSDENTEVVDGKEIRDTAAKVRLEKADAKKRRKKKRKDKEEQKVRRKRLREENEAEERNIRQLEKQLGMKKKKSKEGKLPKSFSEDGLDFLLDLCDPEKVKSLAQGSADEDGEEEDGGKAIKDLEDDDSENEGVSEIEDDEEEEQVDEDTPDEFQYLDDNEGGTDNSDHHSEDSDGSDGEESEKEDSEKEEGRELPSGGIVREDIYGRLRDKDGNLVTENRSLGTEPGPNKYVPPALRAKMLGDGDEKRREEVLRLQKKVKGLLNRLAASNMAGIAREIESLYGTHSRNDMNECLSKLFVDSLVAPVLTPERLIMEHALLVAVLHANVGVEVGATLLQSMVKKFHQAYLDYEEPEPSGKGLESDKTLDNFICIISHLFTFRVTSSALIFDVVHMLADSFLAKDVELILLVLKTVGFGLRKEDPDALKGVILKIQEKSKNSSHLKNDSRMKFMLEVLMAIKNNNVKKIPNYDTEHQKHLQKNMKQFVRPGVTMNNPFKIRLEDLLKADERGRWWIVGSAWSGKTDLQDSAPEGSNSSAAVQDFSSELLELARKMRMNTESRKNIFCTVMAAEDYLDAFEKLTKLPVRTQKEREVAFVLLDCCLQERSFNPYYSQLVTRLASFDRKYRIAAQFALWDKVKEAASLKKAQRSNLASFTCFLIREGTLSIACLKVIEFADLDEVYVAFLRRVLTELLTVTDVDNFKRIFSAAAAGREKLRTLREGLRLFMRHFILKGSKTPPDELEALEKRVELAESCFATYIC